MEEKVFEIENLHKEEDERNQEILKKYPKYLPIGSVVILNYALKKIMITGYVPVNEKDENEEYDYIGCLYPEGVIRSDDNYCFNHEDISKICAIGLKDDEGKNFINSLNKLVEMRKENK